MFNKLRLPIRTYYDTIITTYMHYIQKPLVCSSSQAHNFSARAESCALAGIGPTRAHGMRNFRQQLGFHMINLVALSFTFPL